jgi:glycosyltransferase involved in cell wall biosynthesis
MMHVGFIVPGSLDNHSGGFLYDRMLVQHLRSRGWRIDVIPVAWGRYAEDLLRNLGLTSPQRFDPGSLDLLLEDELSHPALLSLNRGIRRQTNLPIVAVVHHLRSSEARSGRMNALYRWIERLYLTDIDGAICNSLATRQSVEALWPEARPSVVAYPGRAQMKSQVNPEDVRTRAWSAGPLKIVFVGNLIPRKGLLTLLDALAGISQLDWELDVVGDPSIDRAHLRRIRWAIARAGLDHRVRLRGRLEERSLSALLAEAHTMVVPSTYEGFGIAYLDGMAYGLPAVGTTAGGAAELVHHGHNGFLIQPGDANSLAQSLASLMCDRKALAKMGVAALGTYRNHPSWSDSGEVVRSFLLGMKDKAYEPAAASPRSQHFTTAGGPL